MASERNVTQPENLGVLRFLLQLPLKASNQRTEVVVRVMRLITFDISVIIQDVWKVSDYCLFVYNFCVINSNLLLQILLVLYFHNPVLHVNPEHQMIC